MTTRVSTIWLRAASVVTILTGVICALASHSSTGGLWLYPVSYTHLTLPTIYSV